MVRLRSQVFFDASDNLIIFLERLGVESALLFFFGFIPNADDFVVET